jgi:glycosyltransferase involved in cell wall biosynthesis
LKAQQNNMASQANRILSLARYLYHRVPLPQTVKWSLREKVSPLLLALRKSELDGQLFANIRHAILARGVANRIDADALNDALLALYADIAAHCRVHGPLTHILALPFLGRGGAERTALQFARAVLEKESHRSVGIWVTDRDMVSDGVMMPNGVHLVNLWRYFPAGLDEALRISLLRSCLLTLRPEVFHVINSDVGWKLICAGKGELPSGIRLFGSIFAFQFAPDFSARTGYAEYYLRDAIDRLDGLFSDNERFVQDAMETYGLSRARDKFAAVYNACRVTAGNWRDTARQRLADMEAAADQEPLNVLWAGRLDEEKRVDLLYEVAARCPGMRFHVYGENVVGNRARMDRMSNVQYHGPFSDPVDIVNARVHHAFMFTSRWEGMPNMLLEIGALGVPILAPDVGGIRELISAETGYLLPERATADDYVNGLTAIAGDGAEAVRRALALQELIAVRHTWSAFVDRLSSVPGYL